MKKNLVIYSILLFVSGLSAIIFLFCMAILLCE